MNAVPQAPIVVGVAGSPSSRRAVRLAADEAIRQRRPLHLVHALTWRQENPDSPEDWSREAAEQTMDDATRAVAGFTDLETRVKIIEGEPVGVLLHASRSAALVVIGDGGLAAQLTLPVDAVAVEVTSRADCSVMVVREGAILAGHADSTRPVVVGIDGTERGDQALRFAFDYAAHRDVELVIVHVEEQELTLERVVSNISSEEAIKYQQKYPNVVVQIRELPGDPARVLIGEAARASLVVVGARGERPSHGLLGPVSLDVLHLAPCPVVIVRTRPHPTVKERPTT